MSTERVLNNLFYMPLFIVCFLFVPAYAMAAAQSQGIVDGKLINGTDSSLIPADVDLDVISLNNGMSIIKSGKTDREGKFRFDGVPTDAEIMIRANYKSASYLAQATFDKSDKASVEIKVYETTKSMNGIKVQAIQIAIQSTGGRLQAVETISFDNQTKPPQTFMNEEGNYRFSKLADILEVPEMRVTAPGSSMPLTQTPLESPDGQSYYSIYPLRPGVTTFEVRQILPYQNKSYIFRKRFFYDANAFNIGVIPYDTNLSGDGLSKIQTDVEKNFSVYRGGQVKAGTEVVFTLSGGTTSPGTQTSSETTDSGQTTIRSFPNTVGLNAATIVSLLLMGFVLVLWYAINFVQPGMRGNRSSDVKELGSRYGRLLNFLAVLDHQYETQSLDRREYIRQREYGKRLLRRISELLNK
jgi:hypothetical protein